MKILLVTQWLQFVQAALLAHIGDHAAAWYRQQAEIASLQMGIQMPPPGQPMPPPVEAAVARAVAQVSDSIIQKLGGMLGAGMDPAKQAEVAVGLFGTKAEDLGNTLMAMDPSTAVVAMGEVAGAADRPAGRRRARAAHPPQRRRPCQPAAPSLGAGDEGLDG